MSAAMEIQIMDAIVAELNNHNTTDPDNVWEVEFEAKGGFLFIQAKEELVTLHVTVAPLEVEYQVDTREVDQFQYGLAINFHKALDRGDLDQLTVEMRNLCRVVEQVQDYYRPIAEVGTRQYHELTDLDGWFVVDCQREAIYDLELLHMRSEFESTLAVTVQGQR